MLSMDKIEDAGVASSYYNKDDYYTRDSPPSSWQGGGADRLGLTGTVDKEEFRRLLEGWVSDTTRLGGRDRQGDPEAAATWIHTPGWDLTFSAPKSVSILAEVLGDERLILAHDEAVRETIAYAEERYATTRTKIDSERHYVRTGNLVVATFRHDLSREQDPQLHTHCVVANATWYNNKWMSLHSQPLYAGKLDLGLYYRQELALRAAELGYEIVRGAGGLFEIAGVNDASLNALSKRSQRINARLDVMGLDRDSASAEQIAKVTLQTRPKKQSTDRSEMVERWRAEIGPAITHLEALKTTAEATAATVPPAPLEARNVAAEDAVDRAAKALSERSAAFAHEHLTALASTMAVGSAKRTDIEQAIRNKANITLTERNVVIPDRQEKVDAEAAGFTTERAETLERRTIASLVEGMGTGRQIMRRSRAITAVSRAERSAEAAGYPWNDAQRDATLMLLTTRDRVVGVQGLAGVAKTTTVLATMADIAKTQRHQIVALAPTAAAAQVLGEAVRSDGRTLDAFLQTTERTRNPTRAKAIWILDEATLASTDKVYRLMRQAQRFDAKLILVGDVSQLGSVEAGAAFRQLQEAGMRTGILDNIVRQSNSELRSAIYDTIQRRAASAIERINNGGGKLVEAADPDERYKILAGQFLSLSPKDRRDTIVIDPSKEGRERLTTAIRDGLVEEATLGRKKLDTTTLVAKSMSAAERMDATFYKVGDIVLLPGAAGARGRHEYTTVLAKSTINNVLVLQHEDGRRAEWRPDKHGSKIEAFTQEPRDLRVGDKIVWTRNDSKAGRTNQAPGEILAIDETSRTATISTKRGSQTVEIDKMTDKHWTHDYVKTSFAAQGKTADRAIVHAEGWRLNLTNMRSFYVQISRPREHVFIVTDSVEALTKGIAGRAGQNATAIDVSPGTPPPEPPEPRRFNLSDVLAKILPRATERPVPHPEAAPEPVTADKTKKGGLTR